MTFTVVLCIIGYMNILYHVSYIMAGQNFEKENLSIFELDTNKFVTVNLTKRWREILRDYYLWRVKDSDIYKKNGCNNIEEWIENTYIKPEDKSGYFQFQFWELMAIFWGSLYNYVGADKPFEKFYFSEGDKESYWAKKVTEATSGGLLSLFNNL